MVIIDDIHACAGWVDNISMGVPIDVWVATSRRANPSISQGADVGFYVNLISSRFVHLLTTNKS